MDAFAENIIEKTPIIFNDSFFETPNINQTYSQSFSNSFSRESRSSLIPDFDITANMPAVPHINHDAENIRETESLADNMFDKLKVDAINKEIMRQLQKGTDFFFFFYRTSSRYLKRNVNTQMGWFTLKNWKKK